MSQKERKRLTVMLTNTPVRGFDRLAPILEFILDNRHHFLSSFSNMLAPSARCDDNPGCFRPVACDQLFSTNPKPHSKACGREAQCNFENNSSISCHAQKLTSVLTRAGRTTSSIKSPRTPGIECSTLVRHDHKSPSSNSAILIKARSKPILSGRLPWIGITILSRRPGFTKIWWLP
jgi:hypothetical protein